MAAAVRFVVGQEGGESDTGLPPELFVELLGFMGPPWDPARRGLPLGGRETLAEMEAEEAEEAEEEEWSYYESDEEDEESESEAA